LTFKRNQKNSTTKNQSKYNFTWMSLFTLGNAILEPLSDNHHLAKVISINTKRVPHSLFPAVVWKTVDVGSNLENFAVEPSAGLPGFGT